jgi:hypothetical protein
MTLSTPVAFFVYNRPDLTELVLASIAQAKPSRLLVVADGPRAAILGEAEKCSAVRKIIDRVNWNCEVLKHYSDENLGCKRRVSSGLDWVFEQCEEAIILEDDCRPDRTFFRFCEELLHRYRYDERVMMISGDNFHLGSGHTDYSYYFSRCIHIWGWASWRRAWRSFDPDMGRWPLLRDTPWLHEVLSHEDTASRWNRIFDLTFAEGIDTWDYNWVFSCWVQNGLSIIPNTNLVLNAGFRKDATHTTDSASRLANLPTGEMAFPLRHPPDVIRDVERDLAMFRDESARDSVSRLPQGAVASWRNFMPRGLASILGRMRANWP